MGKEEKAKMKLKEIQEESKIDYDGEKVEMFHFDVKGDTVKLGFNDKFLEADFVKSKLEPELEKNNIKRKKE